MLWLQPSISQTSGLLLKECFMDREPGWFVWSLERDKIHLDGQPQGMLIYSRAAYGEEAAVRSNLARILIEKAVWCNWA